VSSEGKRSLRVAERVREELAKALAREVSDPMLMGIIISRIELTDDLSLARVYFRTLTVGDEPADLKLVTTRLFRFGRRMRGAIGRRLGLRIAPEFRFLFDRGQDNAIRVQELLSEVDRELAQRKPT
jgi:ribosome-binding factor A